MKRVCLGCLLLPFVFYGCGGQSNPSVTQVTHPTAIGYVANTVSNSVTSFLLDETTGALAAAATAPAGNAPGIAMVTPDRRLLFVSNTRDGTISRYVLDGNGGMQSAGPAVHLATPNGQPFALAVAPSGKFLYVGTSAPAIEIFGIDAATGNLQSLANSPITVPLPMPAIALMHSGQFLYGLGENSDAIYIFSVDATTGGLTALEPLHTGVDVAALAIHPSDTYLFVPTFQTEKLLVYAIQSSGALVETTASRLPTGYEAVFPAVAPNGRFLYLADPFFDNGILAYAVDPSTGAVTPVQGSPFFDGQDPISVAVSPNSNILVVSRFNPGHVASYRIDPQTGALSPISGASSTSGLATGDDPNNVILVPK